MSIQDNRIVIWRFSDSKPGHDTQSQGLIQALSRLAQCEIHHIKAPSNLFACLGFLSRGNAQARHLPDPDLIVGAGHRTHIPVLISKQTRGGLSIVLMRPSLPIGWFDLCLIPEHDAAPVKKNVLQTKGALCTINATSIKNDNLGLVLVGGPSRHYSWDSKRLSSMIQNIVTRDMCRWTLVDSPRTPDNTRAEFKKFTFSNCEFRPYIETDRAWVEQQIATSSKIWVTEDSASMLYEAISSGAAVGVLPVPVKQHNKISKSVLKLRQENYCYFFSDWDSGQGLKVPQKVLDESSRCAKYVLDLVTQTKHKSNA